MKIFTKSMKYFTNSIPGAYREAAVVVKYQVYIAHIHQKSTPSCESVGSLKVQVGAYLHPIKQQTNKKENKKTKHNYQVLQSKKEGRVLPVVNGAEVGRSQERQAKG